MQKIDADTDYLPLLTGLTGRLIISRKIRPAAQSINNRPATSMPMASAQCVGKLGMNIVVHDGESGESKSVGLMSGGERVFVNECLIRAVALYLAQHTGRQYDTLFSDEADGPLDPERKRMLMAM